MRSSSDPTVLRRQRLGVVGVAVAALAAIGLLGAWAGDLWETGQADGATNPAGDVDVGFVPSLDGPIISEVMSSNGSTLADEDEDFSDWIELHNPSPEPVELDGYFLSDDDEEPDRWQVPAVILEPGGFLVVFASGKDRSDPAGELHTDFRVAQGDEPVLLVAPDGETVVDRLPGEGVPRDASIGRDPEDLTRVCLFAEPTPGEPNVPTCFDDTELGAPTLSHSSGFYDESFELEISATDPGATIIYTLDGSYPDLHANPGRTFVYGDPLTIEDRTGEPPAIATIDSTASDHPYVAERQARFGMPDLRDVALEQATVVRARSDYSAASTATYFVGEERRREGLTVVSLVMDADFLFDHETGVYVAGRTYDEWRESEDFDPHAAWDVPTNYNQRGRAWERPFEHELGDAVVLEVCHPGGQCSYQREIGIRTHGGFSRTLPQKSLRLYARNDYGDRRFRESLFGEDGPQGHRRLILRNSGNDNGFLMFADAYLQSLMGDLAADTQAYEPTVVFINGEYWGIQNLRERYDRHYLEVVHGADPARVEILDNSSPPLVSNRPGGVAAWQELLAELGTYEPTSERFVSELERAVEVDSFFDFIIAHVFVGNRDSISNNARWWREPGGPDALGAGTRDGRWRWLISDFDNSGGGVGRYHASYDVFPDRLPSGAEPSYRDGIPFLFDRTMENEALRNRFLNRFADHLNTTFDSERTVEVLDTTADRLRDEIDLHAVRWRRDMTEKWEGRVAELETFMHERPHIQRQQLVQRFALDGTATLGVQTAGSGTVRVNEIEVASAAPGGAWRGVYFLGVPVTLRAEPLDGYRFVRWEGIDVAATDPEMTLPIRDDVEVEAVFEPVT